MANCNVHFADGVEDESQLMSRLFLAELNHEESLDGSQVSGNDISLVDCICSCRYVRGNWYYYYPTVGQKI